MADKTKIQWTEATWNPIRARNIATGKAGWYCEHVTPGCENCYAETLNKRLGTGLPFKPGHRKDVEIYLDMNVITQPTRWRRGRMVFVCSMSDLFGGFVKVEWIDRIFAEMAMTPQHTYQVLTKRPEKMLRYLTDLETVRRIEWHIGEVFGPGRGKINLPLPNVWLGVSAEDQQRFDERWTILRDTPAAIRFLSIEPQVGRVDMSGQIGIWLRQIFNGSFEWMKDPTSHPVKPDWVIVGGESGHDARPFDVLWAEVLIRQCKAAGIDCFIKQLGARPIKYDGEGFIHAWSLIDKKGGDINEWPANLQVRETPRA